MTLTAETRVFALLGNPVGHSLSPTMQNAAFGAAGVDGVYVALRCDPGRVEGLMRGLAGAGGGGNVTLPHKEEAAAALDVPSEVVRRTGACNTFWADAEGRLHGDNTDVVGFRTALRGLLPPAATGIRALLLGAGGAARAALLGLVEEGAGEVLVLNRTLERARAMADALGGGRARVVTSLETLAGERFDMVVNATRLGLKAGDPLPLDLDAVGEVGAVMDLVYGQEPTAWVRAAAAAGLPAVDGAEMLLGQGAAAFERWWNRPAPLAEMRAALARGAPAAAGG